MKTPIYFQLHVIMNVIIPVITSIVIDHNVIIVSHALIHYVMYGGVQIN